MCGASGQFVLQKPTPHKKFEGKPSAIYKLDSLSSRSSFSRGSSVSRGLRFWVLVLRSSFSRQPTRKRQSKFTNSFYRVKFNLFVLGAGRPLTQRKRLLKVVSLSGSVGETKCSQGIHGEVVIKYVC